MNDEMRCREIEGREGEKIIFKYLFKIRIWGNIFLCLHQCGFYQVNRILVLVMGLVQGWQSFLGTSNLLQIFLIS